VELQDGARKTGSRADRIVADHFGVQLPRELSGSCFPLLNQSCCAARVVLRDNWPLKNGIRQLGAASGIPFRLISSPNRSQKIPTGNCPTTSHQGWPAPEEENHEALR
jgi:hypothetical protein